MIVDSLTIRIGAGRGGDGIVSFNKNLNALGPTGGSGGNGGDVSFIGVSDLAALNALRNRKVFLAPDGKKGRHQLNDGGAGEHLVISVPVGTVIHNLTTGEDREIIKVGEQVPGARGGRGGKGNFHYRGPRRTSPMKFQTGLPGEQFNILLELKMIADIGIIGLPNVGKSTLLNELTKARSKVADYHFTTLEPHLGSFYGLILADIPGLIEGASRGKGLGIKFLRHIERTRVLFHLVSADSENPVLDYQTVRAELGEYHPAMLKKDEYLFLSKSDTTDTLTVQKHLSELKRLNPSATVISVLDPDSMAAVRNILTAIAAEKGI